MASFGEVTGVTQRAAADLRTKQYYMLRNTASGLVNTSSHAAGAATTLIGVLQNKPNSGQAANVGMFGESKVVAAGTVAVNVWLTTDDSGKATAAVSGDNVIGYAMEAASTGETFRAFISAVRPLLRT